MRFLAVLVVLTLTGGGIHADEGKLRKVHVVVIADTSDPSLGSKIELSRERLEKIIRVQIDKKHLCLTTLTPDDADALEPKAVLDAIKKLGDLSGQTVLCYYMGHGGVDANNKGEPFLYLHGARRRGEGDKTRLVYRKELLTALKETKASLRVLITDASAAKVAALNEPVRAPDLVVDDKVEAVRVSDARGVTFAAARGAEDKLGTIKNKKQTTLESLLLRYAGEVDINGASAGQDAYLTKETVGGIFSYAFTELAQSESLESWDKAKEYLIRETEAQFLVLLRGAKDGAYGTAISDKIIAQGKQTPVVKFSGDLRALPK